MVLNAWIQVLRMTDFKTGPQTKYCVEPSKFIKHGENIDTSTIIDIPLTKFLFKLIHIDVI